MIGIIILEIAIVIALIAAVYFSIKSGQKNILRKFIIITVGVLLFEIMSEPMWNNTGFQAWAYIYGDITWVLTLGWVALIMLAMLLVDHAFAAMPEKRKFWLYLLVVEAITIPLEAILLTSGIRSYAPVLTQTMSGKLVPFTAMPIEAIFAIPLFVGLIICFYKYVNHIADNHNQ